MRKENYVGNPKGRNPTMNHENRITNTYTDIPRISIQKCSLIFSLNFQISYFLLLLNILKN